MCYINSLYITLHYSWSPLSLWYITINQSIINGLCVLQSKCWIEQWIVYVVVVSSWCFSGPEPAVPCCLSLAYTSTHGYETSWPWSWFVDTCWYYYRMEVRLANAGQQDCLVVPIVHLTWQPFKSALSQLVSAGSWLRSPSMITE